MPPTHTPKITVSPDFLAICERHGLMTTAARAKAFGVSRATVSNIENGHVAPSAAFIAGVLDAIPRTTFEAVFWTPARRGRAAIALANSKSPARRAS